MEMSLASNRTGALALTAAAVALLAVTLRSRSVIGLIGKLFGLRPASV